MEESVEGQTNEVSTVQNEVFDTQAQAPEQTPSSWKWMEGVDGQGEKPDYFKDSKYTSVAEQAKAYGELEKRLGGFIGAPKEGYQLSEDLGIDSEDPSIKAVLDVLGKSNASNEMANELLATYVQASQEQAQAQITKEMELLGSNADYRINAIKEFASSSVPQDLQDTFSAMVTSAKGVEVIEALMKKAQGSTVAPERVSAPKVDAASLREMMYAKNEHGHLKASVDPEYKRKVDKAYQDFYGNS